MPAKKLTLSVDEKTIEKAKAYSKVHNTSISRLVGGFLEGLSDADNELTPRVKRLLGVLPSDVDVREYRQHLDEKYAS
jgi:hypothetical protein